MTMLAALKAWVATLSTLPAFLEYQPASPDNLICLREYGGAQIRGLTKHDRSVQLLFRADAETAHDAAWAVYGALVPLPPVIVAAGGGKYIVRPRQSPFFMERDASDRSVYVFNVAIIAAPD